MSQAHLTGLVISYYGKTVAVEDPTGLVYSCHLRRNQPLPVVGDQVIWQLGPDQTGTIVSIEPRSSQLMRGEAHGKLKAIAANVDAIFIIMAPPPSFSSFLVDRYTIAAELSNIQPILVINKADLLSPENEKKVEDLLNIYKKVPYTAILSSVYTHDGLQEIAQALAGKTGVLVGPSGVGKSSIIAALGVDSQIRIGEVSDRGAGKHTTTATRLYHLRNGGHLIDSPGVREFNLWEISLEALKQGFPEFKAHQNCKFRDCKHLKEPGCKIKEAVEAGRVHASRYETYQLLAQKVTR